MPEIKKKNKNEGSVYVIVLKAAMQARFPVVNSGQGNIHLMLCHLHCG